MTRYGSEARRPAPGGPPGSRTAPDVSQTFRSRAASRPTPSAVAQTARTTQIGSVQEPVA